jgi:histidine triad (HIT) family protein
MEECIFCKIIKGDVPCFKIFEDEGVLVFLDIKPATKGHALVIPKQHAENIFEVSDGQLEKIAIVAKRVSKRIQHALGADGIRLSQSNGRAAGQEIMHFHLHIIPRYLDDGLSNNPTLTMQFPQADIKELEKVLGKINISGF